MAHAKSIDAGTRLAGILGHPIAHSLSPLIHNTAFKARGLNCRYVALSVHPRDLKDAVGGLRALQFMGANVTLPHKQAVLPLMNSLSETARVVGAVNTIVRRNGELHGDNTDVVGFLEPLNSMGDSLHGADVVIFGAGGAARAAAWSLLTRFAPRNLTIVARTRVSAERLARELARYDPKCALRVTAPAAAAPVVRTCRLLVNCTPVGMYPNADATPWPDAGDFHSAQIVYDLVYRPVQTRLLRDARKKGAHTVGGLDMLIHQAAAAYRQWTGETMPLDPVRCAVLDAAGPPIHSTTKDP